ncbi:hypothetical protein JTE90_028498 [Oedothorax gibbosus]|uniref:Peptidase S1 domain-containing protein n=1 Tax=Oedothorax gibbosus TaxID=931172 RepID=A0AAV6VUG6_9ARAC|nr:hypothetical protein JTE90_028498 [Oedothorax gibbosus]
MTILDCVYKGTFIWLCIIYSLNRGICGHHNDTCQSADGRQAICVANRYCRERFQHHLLPCEDNKICCPIPTTSSPPNPPPSQERRPSNSERPKSPDVDDRQYEDSRRQRRPVDKEIRKSDIDGTPPIKEDERPRRPVVSYGKPKDDVPFREPERSRRPQVYDDDKDPLPSLSEDRRSRNPVRTYDKPGRDSPSRRPVDGGRPRYNEEEDRPSDGRSRRPISPQRNPSLHIPPRNPDRDERRRQNRPTYESSGDRERPRKPIDVYDEPDIDDARRTRNPPRKPVGRPRYEDDIESLPKRPGKVRFEDEYSVDRPSKPREEGRPDEPIYIDDADYDKSDYLPMPRSESSSSSKHRHDIDDVRTRPDDYDRRRQRDDAPSLYPSKDQIDVHRDSPRRDPTIDAPKSTHEFPENPGYSLSSQPKVPECGVKPYELFIAGGEASEPHEWPWMTAIFRRHQSSRPKTFICGGSLINTKYILTAAHCFVHNYKILPASSFVVRVGSHQLNSGEEYTVSEVIVHHNHTGSDFFNDIALIKLASDVYVTDKVAPICLPSTDMAAEDFVGRMATVAGWGDTAFRTGGSRTLQHVTIPVVSGEECFAAYSRVKGAAFLARGSDHVICAGLREGGKDACLGDSGGPLMLKASEDRWIVVGVVSLGYKCAEPGYPGVYTRVTHYIPWIQNNVKRH